MEEVQRQLYHSRNSCKILCFLWQWVLRIPESGAMELGHVNRAFDGYSLPGLSEIDSSYAFMPSIEMISRCHKAGDMNFCLHVLRGWCA